MKGKTEDNKKGSILPKTGLAFFIVAAIIFVVIFIRNKANESNANSIMDDMQSQIATSETSVDMTDTRLAGINVPPRNIDFESLQINNSDIYAWIYVPGTSIDYPVLQYATDDSYYLERNIDRSVGYPGCIYTESSVNSKNFTDYNTVLYGHNMLNGTMFATLHRFEDAAFFEQNQYIYIYTEEKTYVYQIFAAYTYSDKHLLKGIDISTKELFGNYIEEIYSNRSLSNNFNQDITVTSDNHIITLSTCTSQDTKRYLVQGVLLND